MHNLTGTFIDEGKTKVEGMDLYFFTTIYPQKSRVYYTDSKEDCLSWVEKD